MPFNAIIVFSILITKKQDNIKGNNFFFNFVEYIPISSPCFSWIAKAKIVQYLKKCCNIGVVKVSIVNSFQLSKTEKRESKNEKRLEIAKVREKKVGKKERERVWVRD